MYLCICTHEWKIKKTRWQMRRECVSCNEERWIETWCVCQSTSPYEIQEEGWSILPPCLQIAAVALYISFCRQSALAAEAECTHQSRIRSLWQYKVRTPKLNCFSEGLRKKVLFCKFAANTEQKEWMAASIVLFISTQNLDVNSLWDMIHNWPVQFFLQSETVIGKINWYREK